MHLRRLVIDLEHESLFSFKYDILMHDLDILEPPIRLIIFEVVEGKFVFENLQADFVGFLLC